MRVAVTGGAGFIGSHLVDALVDRGDAVVVLDDLSTGERSNLAEAGAAATLHVGSVTDRAAVEAAVEGCEIVFHLAAVASVQRTVEAPVDTQAVNFGGALNVLESARAAGVRRVVFAGSAAVYGDAPALPASESATPCPQSPYAVEKLCAEHYMKVWSQLFGLQTATLRFFNVFGPRQDPSSPYSGVISVFVDRLTSGQPPVLHGGGAQTRDFVYVADVVSALLAAGEVPAADGGVFNVGRGEETSVAEICATIGAAVGATVQPEHGPTRSGDIARSVADIGAARRVLGYEPRVGIAEGIGRLVDHEQRRSVGQG